MQCMLTLWNICYANNEQSLNDCNINRVIGEVSWGHLMKKEIWFGGLLKLTVSVFSLLNNCCTLKQATKKCCPSDSWVSCFTLCYMFVSLFVTCMNWSISCLIQNFKVTWELIINWDLLYSKNIAQTKWTCWFW